MSPKLLYKIMLGVIILFILGFGYLFYILNNGLTSSQNEISKVLAQEKVAQENRKQLKQLQEQFSDISSLRSEIEEVLPSSKKQAEIIAQLVTIANSTGLDLDTLNFDPTQGLPGELTQTQETEYEGIVVVPVNFQTTGFYFQLLQFLREIETLQRHVQVEQLGVSSGESEDNTSSKLNFNVKLNVYLQP